MGLLSLCMWRTNRCLVCVCACHRLRKVWQKRKCTAKNGYLTISHGTVSKQRFFFLCVCVSELKTTQDQDQCVYSDYNKCTHMWTDLHTCHTLICGSNVRGAFTCELGLSDNDQPGTRVFKLQLYVPIHRFVSSPTRIQLNTTLSLIYVVVTLPPSLSGRLTGRQLNSTCSPARWNTTLRRREALTSYPVSYAFYLTYIPKRNDVQQTLQFTFI